MNWDEEDIVAVLLLFPLSSAFSCVEPTEAKAASRGSIVPDEDGALGGSTVGAKRASSEVCLCKRVEGVGKGPKGSGSVSPLALAGELETVADPVVFVVRPPLVEEVTVGGGTTTGNEASIALVGVTLAGGIGLPGVTYRLNSYLLRINVSIMDELSVSLGRTPYDGKVAS